LPEGGIVDGMKLQDVGPTLLGVLRLPAMDPARGSGLAEADSVFAPLALGHDLSDRLRAAAGQVATCQPPAMLAEGMLYGPSRTRLMRADGGTLIRNDPALEFTRMNVCDDPREARPATAAECSPEEETVLQGIDAWRERNAGRGTSVEIDPQLRRSLGALGYVH